jgi:sterol O-acyltransferase
MIVHDSLYNYIYVDLRRLGLPQGACFFVTFLVSALVHEYIISLSLKFFYPVLLFMFLGPTIHAQHSEHGLVVQAGKKDG